MNSKRIEKIANMVLADEQYIYDPRHEMSKTDVSRELGGTVHETPKGWGLGDNTVETTTESSHMSHVRYIDSLIETPIGEHGANYHVLMDADRKLPAEMNDISDRKWEYKRVSRLIGSLLSDMDDGLDESTVIGKPLSDNVSVKDHIIVESREHLKSIKDRYISMYDVEYVKERKCIEDRDKVMSGLNETLVSIKNRFLTSLQSKPDANMDEGLCYIPPSAGTDRLIGLRDRVLEGIMWASRTIDWKKTQSPILLKMVNYNKRANYNPVEASINLNELDNPKAYIHELGHHLEMQHDEIGKMAKEFYERRTRNSTLVKMKDIDPYGGYMDDEYTRPDSFMNPYTGKHYNNGYTEIISMGIEHMYTDPVKFRLKDPEHFELTLKALGLVKH
jgi:hypothetical protein